MNTAVWSLSRTVRPRMWMAAGDNFSYQEVMESSGPITAALAALALALGFAALRFLRGLMLYLLPKPGEGPSKDMQARPRAQLCVAGCPHVPDTRHPAHR